jgi:hypothetical protein
VPCPRSAPSTKRLIRSSRKSRGNHIARIKSSDAFLHNLGHSRPTHSAPVSANVRYAPKSDQNLGLGGMTRSASKRHRADGWQKAPSPAYVPDLLATSDYLANTKAFIRIKDGRLRRRIVNLVEEVAD